MSGTINQIAPPRPRDTSEGESLVLIWPLLLAVWVYRRVIFVITLTAVVLYMTVALVVYVRQPNVRQASLPFRVLFDGADVGSYPSGIAFSRADTIATPVLNTVFTQNRLSQFTDFATFQQSLFVLESSREAELLALDYRNRLADARLTAVDRARIEAEYLQKLDSVRSQQYILNFVSATENWPFPEVLMQKVLNDVLATWAVQVAENKGALKYQIESFTPALFAHGSSVDRGLLRRGDLLRGQFGRLISNIDDLTELPGGKVIRSSPDKPSLPELRATLDDALRYELEPLVGQLRAVANDDVKGYLEDRLEFARRQQREALENSRTMTESFRTYLSQYETPAAQTTLSGSASANPAVPQLSDSFLDRLITMSRHQDDVKFRQDMTTKIINTSQRATRLENEVSFYQQLLSRSSSASRADRSVDVLRAELDGLEKRLVEASREVKSLFDAISAHNLGARTSLYAVTGPFTISTQRAITLRALAVTGLMITVAIAVIASLGSLVHHYRRF